MNENRRDVLETDHLDSVYEIETLLVMLKECNDRISYYKDLKKFRVDSINDTLEQWDSKCQKIRSIIQSTLSHFDERSLDFPGIGKVSRRKGKDSWVVKDESALLDYLDQKGVKASVVTTKEVVNKRDMSKLVDAYASQGENIPGVSKVQGSESLTVTINKDMDVTKAKAKAESQTTTSSSLDEIDQLEL